MKTVSLLAKMALRNLWRNARRSLLTIATISFGLAVLLWIECILEGRNKSIIEKITSGNVGHVQVYDHRYLKDKQIQFSMKRMPDGLGEIKDAVYARRVQVPALISSGENSSTVFFQGIEPEAEAKITSIKSFLVDGEFLENAPEESCETKQVVIGKGLGELLAVDIGDKIVMMTQAVDGSMGSDAYRVKGFFESKSPEFDKRYVFGSLGCAAALASLQGFHEVVIRLSDERLGEGVRARLAQSAGPDFEVTTWREALPNMATMVRYNGATFALLSIILFTVISLGIINTLLMSVFERTREFGVMLALGTSPGQLALIIGLESLFLGVISAFAGTVLGMGVLLYHAHVGFDLTPLLGDAHPVGDFQLDMLVFPVIQFQSYLRSVGVTLIVVLLAALYPAYRATRLNPVESLRHT